MPGTASFCDSSGRFAKFAAMRRGPVAREGGLSEFDADQRQRVPAEQHLRMTSAVWNDPRHWRIANVRREHPKRMTMATNKRRGNNGANILVE
jgi:hypothetical protein